MSENGCAKVRQGLLEVIDFVCAKVCCVKVRQGSPIIGHKPAPVMAFRRCAKVRQGCVKVSPHTPPYTLAHPLRGSRRVKSSQ